MDQLLLSKSMRRWWVLILPVLEEVQPGLIKQQQSSWHQWDALLHLFVSFLLQWKQNSHCQLNMHTGAWTPVFYNDDTVVTFSQTNTMKCWHQWDTTIDSLCSLSSNEDASGTPKQTWWSGILLLLTLPLNSFFIRNFRFKGSEWNASDLVGLKELGISYILNITREVDNFFPHNMTYYNIRVYDEETTELLKHWDHTFRFIERARYWNISLQCFCFFSCCVRVLASRLCCLTAISMLKNLMKGHSLRKEILAERKFAGFVKVTAKFLNFFVKRQIILSSNIIILFL